MSILMGILVLVALMSVPIILATSMDRDEKKELCVDTGEIGIGDSLQITSSSQEGFWLLPTKERNKIEQREWSKEWDSEFKEALGDYHKHLYGLSEEDEADYLKIQREIKYTLARVKHVKDVKHMDWHYDPEVIELRTMGGGVVQTLINWHRSVLEDVWFKDLNNTEEIPTAYRQCGCVQCYKRLTDYLRVYRDIYECQLTPKGKERYSARNIENLPGYNAIKYMDPKDKGVQIGRETKKAIAKVKELYPHSNISNGMITADKITAGSISARHISIDSPASLIV